MCYNSSHRGIMNKDNEISDLPIEEDIKKIKHYIDNDQFCRAMVDWKKVVEEAENSGDAKPPVTNYIAECFLKIAEHLSHRPNFINYPYREDMIGDGVENCLLYAHNFDPSKSSNPFSYFTQIIYYAFLRRIEKEKKQSYVKYKALQMNDIDGKFTEWLQYQQGCFTFNEFLQQTFFLSEQDIENIEPKSKQKTGRKKKKNDFFE